MFHLFLGQIARIVLSFIVCLILLGHLSAQSLNLGVIFQAPNAGERKPVFASCVLGSDNKALSHSQASAVSAPAVSSANVQVFRVGCLGAQRSLYLQFFFLRSNDIS